MIDPSTAASTLANGALANGLNGINIPSMNTAIPATAGGINGLNGLNIPVAAQ